MKHARLYYPGEISPERTIIPSQSQYHYLKNVMRLQVGDTIGLFNSEDGEWSCLLCVDENDPKSSFMLKVCEKRANDNESPLKIHLGQAVSRGKRMDLTIQKSTELGVASITPIISKRCQFVKKISALDKKKDHWGSVAENAARQSLRTAPTVLESAQDLSDWITSPNYEIKLILHESASATNRNPLSLLPKNSQDITSQRIALLVGPEGGFTEDEVDMALQSGFQPWLLGPRLLRTETAAPTALAILQYLYGDLGGKDS